MYIVNTLVLFILLYNNARMVVEFITTLTYGKNNSI